MTHDIELAYGWSSQQESESNRLKSIDPYKCTVSAAEADIWFKVGAQKVTPGTEVLGRIVGPRCLFSQEARVVSPLRSVRSKERDQLILIARTAFPNPGFWTPKNPLLYRLVVELWQDGRRCELLGFDIGFRAVAWGKGNVLVNGEPICLQGMACLPQSKEETVDRRQAGYNLLLTAKGQWHQWVYANPMGFLLMERVALSTLTPHYIGLLTGQPCFLGFVLDKEVLDRSQKDNEAFLRLWRQRGVCIGLEVDGPLPASLPDGFSFLVCPESVLPALGKTSLPKFVLRQSKPSTEEPPARPKPEVLGWIDQ